MGTDEFPVDVRPIAVEAVDFVFVEGNEELESLLCTRDRGVDNDVALDGVTSDMFVAVEAGGMAGTRSTWSELMERTGRDGDFQ